MTATAQLTLDLAPLVEPDHSDAKLTIQQRFDLFHLLNPWVYRVLEQLTGDYLASGRSRIGIKMLVEVIRWQYDRSTTGDAFKVNNDYTSRYARLLVADHPEWSYAFNTRALRS